jgi:hypothetical protein
MVIAPAMTIPGTNHFASTPDVIAAPFSSASVNEPRRLEPSFSIHFIAHLKYSQMMKEQAGGDPRYEILQCNRNLSFDVESLQGIPRALMMDMIT